MASRRKFIGIGAFLAAMALFGCSSSSPTLPMTARKIEELPGETFNLLPRPATSDARGKEWLTQMIDAHTGGKPERLSAFKSCTMTRSGIIGPGDPGTPSVTAEWVSDWAWPHFYRFNSSFANNNDRNVYIMGTSPKPWYVQAKYDKLAPGRPVEEMKREANELQTRILRAQQNEDAFAMLFPLSDASTMVALAEESNVGGKPTQGLHVWTPAIAYSQIQVDKSSKLMVQFRAMGVEQGTDIAKTYTLGQFQEFEGVKLPTEMEISASGRVLGRWNKLIVQPGKTFPAKFFEAP